MKGNNSMLHIRSATVDDSERVASLLHASFVEYEAYYTPDGFAATTPNSQQVQQRMDEGPIWVALLDHMIVGTISVVLKAQGVYIRGMAILPDARGQGIGRLLLEKAEVFALSQGTQAVVFEHDTISHPRHSLV